MVRIRTSLTLLCFALLALTTSCDLAFLSAEETPAPRLDGDSIVVQSGYVTDHVIVISIDGLRPDAIDAYGARTMQRLRREGAHANHAQTIVPSKTLPSHASMLTGTGPEVHGVTWNSEELDLRGYITTPTIFAMAKAGGFRTAAVFSKPKLLHLAAPGTLDFVQAPRGTDRWSADRTIDIAEQYLAAARPNLLFVHINEPDFIGHSWGWMTPAYGVAVREADDELAELLHTAERVYGAGNYTVIVTADHGGHGEDHGSADPRDVNIPWIAWGEGIRAGALSTASVRTMDTAATALWLLGIAPDTVMIGQPVSSALAQPTALSR